MTAAGKCITVAVASVAALTITAPAAQAAPPSISPGDRIDYMTDEGSASFCTVGYVYTGSDGHAYAITDYACEFGSRLTVNVRVGALARKAWRAHEFGSRPVSAGRE